MSQPQPIGGTNTKYHWWYDSKSAGVRNPPGANMSGTPPSSPPATDGAPRRFSLTQGWSNASPPTDAARPRRDSLKLIQHLSDFGTPGT